jgi:hypothetical protein
MQLQGKNRMLYSYKQTPTPTQIQTPVTPFARVDANGVLVVADLCWHTFAADCSIAQYQLDGLNTPVVPICQGVRLAWQPIILACTDLYYANSNSQFEHHEFATGEQQRMCEMFIDYVFAIPVGTCRVSKRVSGVNTRSYKGDLYIFTCGQGTVPCPFGRGSTLCAGQPTHSSNRVGVQITHSRAWYFCYNTECKQLSAGGKINVPAHVWNTAFNEMKKKYKNFSIQTMLPESIDNTQTS